HTWIRVEEDFSEEAKQIWAVAVSAGAGVGAAVALPAGLAVLGPTAAGFIAGPLATLALAGVGARQVLRRVRTHRQRTVDALVGQLMREVEALLGGARPGSAGGGGTALLGGP
ncbi:MAG TPA: hypothetical protein VFQ22_12695, partial [Longimicrobiales bacterium]|nr:hypothetical protein [Longimicrobiales bacterium]